MQQEIESDVIVDQNVDESEILSLQESALNDLLSEIVESETELAIKIYSQPGSGHEKLHYLFCAAPGDYSYSDLLERIKEEYGPGHYRIHVRDKEGLKANHAVTIGAPKKNYESEKANNEMNAMLQQMLANNQKMIESMASTIGNIRATQADPMEQQMKFLQQMAMIKEMFVDSSQKREADPLETLKAFTEFQREIDVSKENANSNDVMLSLVEKFLPKIAEMGEKEQAIKASQVASLANARKANPSTVRANTSHSKGADMMKSHLVFLTNMAKKGVHPEPYAHVLLDNTDYEQVPMLKQLLMTPNFVNELSAMHPPAKEHVQWFTDLGEIVLELMKEEEEQAVNDSPSVQGDSGDQVAVTPKQ